MIRKLKKALESAMGDNSKRVSREEFMQLIRKSRMNFMKKEDVNRAMTWKTGLMPKD